MAAAEAAQDMVAAGEAAAEAVEHTVDAAVEVLEVFRTNPVLVAGVGVVSLVAGGFGGYFIAKKHLQKAYDEKANQAAVEAREYYRGLEKVNLDGSPMTPEDYFIQNHGEKALQALDEYRGTVPDAVDEEFARRAEARVMGNDPGEISEDVTVATVEDEAGNVKEEFVEKRVFKSKTLPTQPVEEFDMVEEVINRTHLKPYIVTRDEFFENDLNDEVETVTYFEGDTDFVVADEASVMMPDPESTLGQANMRFGYGSEDGNTVYIRNPQRDTLYEVVRSTGSFAREVAGFQDDEPDSLSHAQRRGQSRRRLARDD